VNKTEVLAIYNGLRTDAISVDVRPTRSMVFSLPESGRKPWEPGEPVRISSGSDRFGTLEFKKFFEFKK
jgi:hypothetical protein